MQSYAAVWPTPDVRIATREGPAELPEGEEDTPWDVWRLPVWGYPCTRTRTSLGGVLTGQWMEPYWNHFGIRAFCNLGTDEDVSTSGSNVYWNHPVDIRGFENSNTRDCIYFWQHVYRWTFVVLATQTLPWMY